MVLPQLAVGTRKEEYFEILDETIRTNPYRKAATAMASVMSKHGIESNASQVLGKAMQATSGTPEKKCALTRALKLAQNCIQKLNVIKEDLQVLCCDVGRTNKCPHSSTSSEGDVPPNPNEPPTPTADDLSDKATMTGHLLTLIGEAETIAKRIYETAVGLHVVEDYLRQPDDIKILDFSQAGRIQIPNYSFNHASQLCLEWLHSTAHKWLRGFKAVGDKDHALFIKIFENFTKAVKDFTEAVCLANQVFRVVLYPNAQGKECLQEYIKGIGHVLKNDIIMEIQSLRRTFDNIQYAFERLGWAASIAWMKYSGKNITVETLNENGIQVDRSRFQYKFYEGPQKSKPKKKVLTQKGKSAKVKKHSSGKGSKKNDVGINAGSSGVPGGRGQQVPTNSLVDVTDKEMGRVTGTDERQILGEQKSAGMAEGDDATPPMARKSRSTSEILKSKKAAKKKAKAKKTKAKDINDEADASGGAGSAGENQVGLSAGDNRQNSKALTNEKSNSSIGSNPKKKQTQALIPPPKIPLALRQQFNAVFGTHLMVPQMKAGKPLKKKPTTTVQQMKQPFFQSLSSMEPTRKEITVTGTQTDNIAKAPAEK